MLLMPVNCAAEIATEVSSQQLAMVSSCDTTLDPKDVYEVRIMFSLHLWQKT